MHLYLESITARCITNNNFPYGSEGHIDYLADVKVKVICYKQIDAIIDFTTLKSIEIDPSYAFVTLI
jgi:hypothetical protein